MRLRVFLLLVGLCGNLACTSRPGIEDEPRNDADGDAGIDDQTDGPAGEDDDQGNQDWNCPDGGGGDFGEGDPLHIGASATLEIATWNLHNFPSEPDTTARVAGLLQAMDLDLVALQEVSDVQAFETLVASLEGFAGVLSPDEYAPGDYQKTGFLYRADRIRVLATQSLFASNSYAFPRPPFRVDLEITPGCGPQLSVIAIVLHLKAGMSASDADRRRDACARLKAYIDSILDGGTETEVLLLGDMNDSIADPAAENVFTAFLDDGADYRFRTLGVEERGEVSFISGHYLIDQILFTTALEERLGPGKTWVVYLDDLVTGYDYEASISDHRPVVSITPF